MVVQKHISSHVLTPTKFRGLNIAGFEQHAIQLVGQLTDSWNRKAQQTS